MSDHWNKLADVLGTPSLEPIQKKSAADSSVTPPPATKIAHSKPMAPESELADEVAKPAKPARRTSWDSITEFFGISSRTPDIEVAAPVESVTNVASILENTIAMPSENKVAPRRPRSEDRSQRRPVVDEKRPKPARPSMWTTTEPSYEVEEPVKEVEPIPSFSPKEPGGSSSLDENAENVERRGRRRRSRRGRNDEPQIRMETPSRPRSPVEDISPIKSFDSEFDDDPPIDDIPIDESSVEWPVTPAVESEDQTSRPRRRRRRRGVNPRTEVGSERPEIAAHDVEDTDFPESIDPDDDSPRRNSHIRVPTWAEAMSILVESNMLNHQRTPSSTGRRRGPPPRRRD